MVLALVRTPEDGPSMKLGPPLPMISTPVPERVTGPSIEMNVLFPLEFSLMVPLLVIVPTKVVVVLLAMLRFPELVRPLKVLLMLVMVAVPAVVSVPPVMVVPFNTTDEPVCALMVPPVLVQEALSN